MNGERRFTFKTKNGTEIHVSGGEPAPNKAQIRATEAMLRAKYGIEYERKACDYSYNCHGMTFINKLGWIGADVPGQERLIRLGQRYVVPTDAQTTETIQSILEGNNLVLKKKLSNFQVDSFANTDDIKIGDIVVYKDGFGNIRHSGIIVKQEEIQGSDHILLRVLSKMARWGEYFHLHNNVEPTYGRTIEVWSDRS